MPTAKQTVDIQGETVAYQVRRSDKASQIRIDADLEGITLIVPEGRDVDPDALLQEKGDWILKQKDRFARHRAQMPERRFEEGETFPVLGTERTVVVEDVPASCVRPKRSAWPRRRSRPPPSRRSWSGSTARRPAATSPSGPITSARCSGSATSRSRSATRRPVGAAIPNGPAH
jgi:Predicted metal-dependent hydrolase